jgi:hypothetical protein
VVQQLLELSAYKETRMLMPCTGGGGFGHLGGSLKVSILARSLSITEQVTESSLIGCKDGCDGGRCI